MLLELDITPPISARVNTYWNPFDAVWALSELVRSNMNVYTDMLIKECANILNRFMPMSMNTLSLS